MNVKVRKRTWHEKKRYQHHEAGRTYWDYEPTYVKRFIYGIVVDGRLVDTALTKRKAEQRARRIRENGIS